MLTSEYSSSLACRLAVLEGREHRAQAGDLLVGRVLRDQARRHAFERRPGGDQLDHLVLGLAHDIDAAPRHRAHEALALELDHRLAHRGAADAEVAARAGARRAAPRRAGCRCRARGSRPGARHRRGRRRSRCPRAGEPQSGPGFDRSRRGRAVHGRILNTPAGPNAIIQYTRAAQPQYRSPRRYRACVRKCLAPRLKAQRQSESRGASTSPGPLSSKRAE